MLAPSKHRLQPLFTWLRLYCPPETFTASLLRVIYCLVFKDFPDLVSHYLPNFTSHCFSNLTLHSSPTKLPNSSPATMPLCTQMALTGIPRAPLHQSISHPSFKDPSQISFQVLFSKTTKKITLHLPHPSLYFGLMSLTTVYFALYFHVHINFSSIGHEPLDSSLFYTQHTVDV